MANAVQKTGRKTRFELPEFSFIQSETSAAAGQGGVLHAFRQNALDVYRKLPFPAMTDEPWRRTSLRGLKTSELLLAEGRKTNGLADIPDDLIRPLAGESHGGMVTLTPNGVTITLDDELAGQGVILADLSTANERHPDLLKKVLGKVVKPDDGKFAALASAMAGQGVLIYIPKGVQVEKPLHSILWAPGNGLAYFSHILVYMEENASLTFVNESASDDVDGGQTMHAGIVAIRIGDDSHLKYIELQSFGKHIWNFVHERVDVGRNASVDWVFGAIGSRMTKNFSDLELTGSGASGRMSGFYFTDGNQHLDHDTQQNHHASFTTSDLLYKGALKGRSRSVWQGMIYVAQGAQQADGYQSNRNLILSKHARADSIPGLEILANDVRCTHGATVGKIDPEMIFYLQSRGIPEKTAQRLVVEGFFEPIMQRIPFDGVRERFQNAILVKMN